MRHDDFGRVFGRAGLSLIEREAIVLGALIAQGAPQISFHSQALLRVGGDEALVDTLLHAVSGISVRVRDLQRPEGRFDGIAHSLRRAPADGELVLNIGNSQAASASLKVSRQTEEFYEAFVTHPAASLLCYSVQKPARKRRTPKRLSVSIDAHNKRFSKALLSMF